MHSLYMNYIPLRNRAGEVIAEAILDDEDFESYGQHRWCLMKNGYAVRAIKISKNKTATYYLHREIVGPYPSGMCVDHVNRNRLDNRRENLRIIPLAANTQNVGPHPNSSSKYRGVTWNKKSKNWQAQVSIDGKNHYLGRFDSEDEAGSVSKEFRLLHMPYCQED